MLLLTETVLFYWDLFDASSLVKGGGPGHGKIREWAQNNVKSGISGARTSASRVTSVSNSRASFARPPPLGIKVKGSITRSSHSFATQPPATPTATPLPTSYLDEDDDIVEFANPAQENTAKDYDVSHSTISDSINVLYDLIEQEFAEVTDFDDLQPFSVMPPLPSQPRVLAKPSVTAKPLKSDVSLYYERYSPDDEVIDKGDEHEHQDIKPSQPSQLRGSKRSSLSQVCH